MKASWWHKKGKFISLLHQLSKWLSFPRSSPSSRLPVELHPLQTHSTQQDEKWEKRWKVPAPSQVSSLWALFPEASWTLLLASHWWDLSCMAIPRGKEGWEQILLEWSLLSMLWIRIHWKGTFKIHLKVGMDVWVSNYLSLTGSIFSPVFIKPNMWLCSQRKQIGGCLETGSRCGKGNYRGAWGILEGMMDLFTILIMTMFRRSTYIKYTHRECTMPNVCVSLNSYVEKPNPQCDGLWRWGLYEVDSSWMRLVPS